MKTFLAIILFASSTLARPEIGIEKKFENSREISAQQLTPITDSAHLPDRIELNERIRTPKDRHTYLEGAQIPVQLVYENSEDGMQAIVKEVSIESLFRKPQGKLLNRVERSKKDVVQDDEILPVDADELNRSLGIEARQSGNEEENDKLSPLDYNYNIIKDIVSNSKKDNGVRRTIQHYQSIFQPARTIVNLPLSEAMYNGNPSTGSKLVKVVSYYPVQESTGVNPENPGNIQFFDDYVPLIVNNPFNSMWSALTNIVEYTPKLDQCKKEIKNQRHKRNLDLLNDESLMIPESVIEDLTRQNSFSLLRPNTVKLKVRRGGIAIAGPGGIATAGSGGTTIVGPGGIALTPPDATAVVGPGGRVIHITNSDLSGVQARTTSNLAELIKRAKIVAHGPIILYSPPPPVETM